MNEHLDVWMDAYLDGEMSAAQRQQAEGHLAHCAECRRLLAERQALSSLLGQLPPAANLMPESAFTAKVNQRLTPRPTWIPQVPPMSWVLIPLGLLVLLSFVETIFVMSSLAGFIPGVAQLLASAVTFQNGLALPEPLGAFMGLIPHLDPFDWNWFTVLLVMGAISLVYVSWLAGWWARNQQANK